MRIHLKEAKDIKDGEMIPVKKEGKDILLVRVEGSLYALKGRCSHLGCFLHKGELKEAIVYCPCHGSSFDVRTGQVVDWISNWPTIIGTMTEKIGLAKALQTYPVVYENEQFYLEL